MAPGRGGGAGARPRRSLAGGRVLPPPRPRGVGPGGAAQGAAAVRLPGLQGVRSLSIVVAETRFLPFAEEHGWMFFTLGGFKGNDICLLFRLSRKDAAAQAARELTKG